MRIPAAAALATVRAVLSDPRRHTGVVVALVAFAASLALWGWRIQRGIDLTDESLYVALPIRFALGDRPFLDDRNSYQGAGILTTPLVFVYRLVVGDSAGVVLFLRASFLLSLAAIGVAVARASRGWIAPGSAIGCGALVCFYVPYYIPQFSYNTVGGGLTMLAAFEALRVARSTTVTEAARHATFCGLAAAGSGLAYPPLVVLFPIHLATLLLLGRARIGALGVAVRYVAGAAILGVYVSLFLLRSGLGSLKLTLQFIQAWGPTLTNTAKAVLANIDGLKSDWFTSMTLALALTIIAMRIRPAVFLLALAVPFLAATNVADVTHSIRFWTCCALVAPLFGLLVKDRRGAFLVLAFVWAPGMIAGFITGYSSGNGATACGLGGFTSMIAGCVLACRACEESLGSLRPVSAGASVIAPLALLYVLSGRVLAPGSMYRDHPTSELIARVRVGPFRGLLTTAARRDFVELVHHDVVAQTASGGFVLCIPDMNYAYLSATARPAIPEIWLTNTPGRSAIDIDILRDRLPDITTVFVRSCAGTGDWSLCRPKILEDGFHDAVNASFVEEFRRSDYAVLKRRR